MTSYTLAIRDMPLFYLSLNMALVVSKSDRKAYRSVLFHGLSKKEKERDQKNVSLQSSVDCSETGTLLYECW